MSPAFLILVVLFSSTKAADSSEKEGTVLSFEILNGIMVSVLFIFGCFMIFAIIQDRGWNNEWGPLWLYVPNIIPAWVSALSFFTYLGLTDNENKGKALLLSITQFQWIWNNTYSMFIQNYMDLSSRIYWIYDERKMNDYELKTRSLPQNKYLVHGLFRLLNKGQSFSNKWTKNVYKRLPILHPDILNIFAQYIDDSDLYEFVDIDLSQDLMQNQREKLSKFYNHHNP